VDHLAVEPISIQHKGSPAMVKRHASARIVTLSTELADQKIARAKEDQSASSFPQWLDDDPDDACLAEELLVALNRATGLSKVELAQLADPRATFTFASACRSLQSLRESHEELDHTLRDLERAIWTRIHEFTRLGIRSSILPAADALGGAERKQIAKCFPRIFLRWGGLREVRRWSENFIAEHEILAQTAGISNTDAETLRGVARNLPAFMEVDEQYKSAWEDLICRINGLYDTPACDAVIEELMP
jgi:hypothetical protein